MDRAWWATVLSVTKSWTRLKPLSTAHIKYKTKHHIYVKRTDFPCGTENACSAGEVSSIPGSGRSPEGGHGNPLQYSCLENPVDRGAWWATVQGAAKSRTRLSTRSSSSLSQSPHGRKSGLQQVHWPGTQKSWSGVSDLACLWQSPHPTVLSPLVNKAVK